jgi:hypothetical protein
VPNDVADSVTYMVRLWYSNIENMGHLDAGGNDMTIGRIIGREG